MPEHYTDATEYVLRYCNKCGRVTEHAVSCGRLGHCKEHETPMKPAKEKKPESGRLFD